MSRSRFRRGDQHGRRFRQAQVGGTTKSNNVITVAPDSAAISHLIRDAVK
jgi:hypothetical protein